jgi:hypothetical protein
MRVNAVPRRSLATDIEKGTVEPETVPEIYKQRVIPEPLMNGTNELPSLHGGIIRQFKIGRQFMKDLKEAGMTPAQYLIKVRKIADAHGYDGGSLIFADDNEHKLMIPNEAGNNVKFGRVGYGDYIIWSELESNGEVRNGFAEQKRRVFQKSHNAIKGKWREDKFSPNNLALRILW